MSTTQIVWLVVGAIVVLALLSLAVMWIRRRNKTANKHRAEQLRARADEHAGLLPDAQAQAKEKAARAERARLEAERAEEEAARAKENVTRQASEYETSIRSADKLDPDVDTRSKDYTPDLPAVDTTPRPTSAPTSEATARGTSSSTSASTSSSTSAGTSSSASDDTSDGTPYVQTDETGATYDANGNRLDEPDTVKDAAPDSDTDADTDDLQDAHDSRRTGWHRR